jgi:hypothetical protein
MTWITWAGTFASFSFRIFSTEKTYKRSYPGAQREMNTGNQTRGNRGHKIP